jgi:ubiquinone/menaquinone biosynthesis C-methylase UbiE
VQKNNSYVIDPESGAEMARLIDQDHMLTKAMGGLFPQDFRPEGGKVILDLACGPGGWAQEVAFNHPSLSIIGIDLSQKMIDYAQSLTQVQYFENLQFEVADVRKIPFDFPDNSFDFINSRLIVGFMSKEAWPRLIQECMRILRPGGTLRFTECDRSSRTSSAAFEEMQDILAGYSYRAKRTFDNMDWGITLRLSQMLRQAGCTDLQVQAHAIDWSAGTSNWPIVCQNFATAYKLMQPYIVQNKAATNEKWEALWNQANTEFYTSDFSALWYLASAWGQKAV